MRLTYTGDPGRYYPRLGLTPEPGQTYTLTDDPADGRWEPAQAPTKKAGSAPEKKEGSDA